MSAKQETELYISALTVDLTQAYLKSRMDCVHAVLDGEVDGMMCLLSTVIMLKISLFLTFLHDFSL
jgi:hypothetical protein